MTQARRQRATTSEPTGWLVLLGLMVAALLLAWIVNDDGGNNDSPAAQNPVTNTTSTAAATTGLALVDEINATLNTGAGLKFVVGKAELTSASFATLDKVAAIFKENPTLKAEVRGYTDNQGDAAKNLTLSQERAQAVVNYLVTKAGIASNRLTASGLGATNPIAPNTTEEGRAKNRRVEFALG
jgi:outer membrane protein OmpA-like peptidoglycan-associated protein